MNSLRIALIQINSIVGGLKGNADKIIHSVEKSIAMGVEIVVFPELSTCGYPPEDLLLKPHFIKENKIYLNKIKSHCKNITAIIGFPDSEKGKIYNSAAIIRDKKLVYTYRKMHLPNYGVFDEKRYFTAGTECAVMHDTGTAWSVNICEDIWVQQGPALNEAKLGGAELIINISASPYHRGKLLQRENILKRHAKQYNAAVAYCNLVGGQDELVFDGGSLIIDNKGRVTARAKQFEEDILVADIEIKGTGRLFKKGSCVKHIKLKPIHTLPKRHLEKKNVVPMPQDEEIYSALVLGTRDYILKNGFKKVILGLSGGIDSSLTALIAVDALGKENVIGVSMPSQFTSTGTKNDAEKLAENLGIEFRTIPITDIFQKYTETLTPQFQNTKWGLAEENIQARIRGNILMAFSNKFGYMVLTTGNKSETSVGYCTLYGDMAGGFAVLKDVPKELVYRLSRYRNKKAKSELTQPLHARAGLIPESVFTRPPTAELRKNQKDEDSLPPYPVLDPIIEAYVEQDKSLDQIIRQGYKKEVVEKIINLVEKNEYKRRQAPPGVKITPKAFGKDRRMPITCKITN